MAASHSVAGEDVENGNGEKADAGGYEDDVEHGGRSGSDRLDGRQCDQWALSAYKIAADLIAPV
jgi:hypothetical protein